MDTIPSLATSRLFIRPLTKQDIGWFIPLHQNSEVMRYSYFRTPSQTQIKMMVEHILLSYDVRGYGQMGCFLQESEEPIGFCGLCLRELNGQWYPELGYRLFPQFWFCGYATEAAAMMKRDAFERLRLPQIFSFIHPHNVRSIRVAEKIGEHLVFKIQINKILWSIYTAYNPVRTSSSQIISYPPISLSSPHVWSA